MENMNEYSEFVSHTLNRVSNYLEVLGYTYQSKEFYYDSLNLENVKIIFSNNLIDRTVEFHYSKNNYGGVYRESVSLFIKKNKGFYGLKGILEHEKINYKESHFLLSSYEGNFEQKVNEFYNYLFDLLENPKLKEWIEGKKWADIPFDWGPYK